MANQQLLDYIKGDLAKGVTEADLRAALSGQGWAQSDVDEAFAAVSGKQAPPAQPIAPHPEPKGGGMKTALIVIVVIFIAAGTYFGTVGRDTLVGWFRAPTDEPEMVRSTVAAELKDQRYENHLLG